MRERSEADIKSSVFALRLLALCPLLLALGVLGIALVLGLGGHRSEINGLWIASAGLTVCACFMFYCAFRAWYRPTPLTVREVCVWTGIVVLGITGLAQEALQNADRNVLRWSVVVGGLATVAWVQGWLAPLLVEKLFGHAPRRHGNR